MKHAKSVGSFCQLNGHLFCTKLRQVCSPFVRNVVYVNKNSMLAVKIKFCIITFSVGIPLKIFFF